MSVANRTAGGWALIAVGLINILVFMIHPVRGDTAPLIGPWGINAITHTLGVGLMPLLALGCWALAEWLGLDRPMVRLALCCNLLGVVLVCMAGLTSGWISPAAFDLGPEFGKLGVMSNRAWDRGYVAFIGLGMALNGLSLPAGRTVLRVFGAVTGLLTVGWVLSGAFDPRVHAMLILSLVQVIWFGAMGWVLLKADPDLPKSDG